MLLWMMAGFLMHFLVGYCWCKEIVWLKETCYTLLLVLSVSQLTKLFKNVDIIIFKLQLFTFFPSNL